MTDPYRRFQLRPSEHTGAVIFSQHRSYTFTGTVEQCEAAYRAAQPRNRGAGHARRRRPTPGWYGDPPGPGLRFWDGDRWTS
ncbi:DUF2510 domain-containing protein [Mycobacterium sp. E2497]|uniref:DUF2510 domain-containing protein n=1 Tax=Mycobacterium sp. E2497 TaxID=1834135 RepID=UPI0008015B53|nr:DUF2510 domain-containing protein [Mycobacterium sp. E2497]OBI12958.1 hypothetical protein A5713_03505 [Mycobacterium sp. E2497]